MCPHQLKLYCINAKLFEKSLFELLTSEHFCPSKCGSKKKTSISRSLEVAFVFGCNIAKDESVNFIVTDDDHEVFAGRDKLTISLIKEW